MVEWMPMGVGEQPLTSISIVRSESVNHPLVRYNETDFILLSRFVSLFTLKNNIIQCH